MKKVVSLVTAAIISVSVFSSCAASFVSPSSASSSAYADEAWLRSRIGDLPDSLSVGTADSLGVDMSSFEDDGYFIREDGGDTVICAKSAVGLDLAVRRYARAVKYGAPVGDVTYHEGYRIDRLTVAGRDISEYTVVYTRTEAPYAGTRWGYPAAAKDITGRTVGNGEFAASEFVRIVREATGVTLPMLDLSSGASLPERYVLFETDERDEGENAFGHSGYSYSVENGNIIFRGSGIANGCANGVYYFAEHILGWSGMIWTDSILAEAEHIDVPDGLSRTGTLTFDHFYQAHCDGEKYRPARDIGYLGYCFHACHGMRDYGFAGEDVDLDSTQPCLTDEIQYETIRDNVEEYIKTRVASGERIGVEFTYVDLAQGDNNNPCSCKNCRNEVKKEGSQSGLWVRLANSISDEMNEKYPGLRYLIFAYAYTKEPPKVTRPNESVNVTFCTDGICYIHSLTSGECWRNTTHTQSLVKNDTIAEWLKKWCEITTYVDVWYYVMDGATSQYDLMRPLFEDVKFFKSLGVRGMYMEGQNYGLGVGRIYHEMFPVLEWEPDMTYDEFLAELDRRIVLGYGEDSEGAFHAARELFRTSVARMGCETCWYNTLYLTACADYAYIAQHMDYVLGLLDGVIADAPSRDAELRAKRLTLMVLYEGISGKYLAAAEAGDDAQIAELAKQYKVFADRAVECGYDLEAFPLGCDLTRVVYPTLEEEAKIWTGEIILPAQ